MSFRRVAPFLLGCCAATIVADAYGQSRPPRVEIDDGERIAIIGNGLAEGMQAHGYFETALHCAHPNQQLLIRNFGQACLTIDGVEVLEAEVDQFKPGILICCFGFNESFAGEAKVEEFGQAIQGFIDRRKAANSAVEIVFLTPIPYFQVTPRLPEAELVNEKLLRYSEVLRTACRKKKAVFLDVFSAIENRAENMDRVFSDNGIHLNAFGHWNLSQILADKLRITVQSPGSEPDAAEFVRTLVLEKNRRWQAARSGGKDDENLAQAELTIREADKPSMTSVWAASPAENPPYRLSKAPLVFQESTLTRVASAKAALLHANGVSVDLWSSEEEAPVMNPKQMEFDGSGRLWVLCSSPEGEDYLIVIEDVDNDHFADRSHLFARGLVNPSSFALFDGSAYVTEQRALVRYGDEDGDGIADSRIELLGGFGSEAGPAGISGLVWAPGGGLWFGQGRGAVSRIETAVGPLEVEGGAIFRFDPRRSDLELITNFDFGAAPALNFDGWGRGYVSDPGRGQTFMLGHVAGRQREDSAIRSMIRVRGRSNPGGSFLGTRHFPAGLRGTYVHHEAGEFRGLRWYRSGRHGAGIRLASHREQLLSSGDTEFRPVDTAVGPDGALYAIDSDGRIWRITAFGRSPLWRENLSGAPISSLLEQLREPEAETRQQTRQELWSRGSADVIPALQTFVDRLASEDPDRQQLLTEAVWLHQAFDQADESLLARLSSSPEPGARAAAARALGFWRKEMGEPLELLKQLIEDPDPRVRLESLQTALRIGSKEAGDVALLAGRYPMDLDLKAVYDLVTQKLGKINGPPSSERAVGVAKSTEDLVKEELTPITADVLLERSGVSGEHLFRAATIAARNRNQTLTRFLIDTLSDTASSNARLRNVNALLPKADGWELHFASTELNELGETTSSKLAREGAYAGLMIAAVTDQTFDRLVESVSRREDLHSLTMLAASAHVIGLESVAARMRPTVRDELGKPKTSAPLMARFVRVVSPRASEFRFAELEVIGSGGNLAKGRPAKQFVAPQLSEWWAGNAGAGANGITQTEKESPVQDEAGKQRPILGVAVRGPAAADEDLWWEVDLGGRGAAVKELVFHPTAYGSQSDWVRFELRDARGQLVWRSSRPVGDRGPLRVPVDLADARIKAAVKVARTIGEDFKKAMVETAEKPGAIGDRFAAMRSLLRLDAAPEHLRISSFEVEISDQFAIAPTSFSIDPKTPVELTIRNGSGTPLNFAILEPGGEAEIGALVKSIANGETEDEDGVPDSAKVLFASALIGAGESTILRFMAPEKPEAYLMMSTTAAAWDKFRGILRVKAPPPPPEPEPVPDPDPEPTS